MSNRGQEIVHSLDFHLVQHGFVTDVFVVGMLRQHIFPFVGKDGKPIVVRTCVQVGQHGGVQQVLVHQFTRLPVDDFAAVVRQYIAFVFVQLQQVRQRSHTVSRPAGRQHNLDTGFLRLQQRFQRMFRNFFLLIGQGPVQVEDQ